MPSIEIHDETWDLDRIPDKCPQCHHAIDARRIGGVVRKAQMGGEAVIEVAFQCPQHRCLRIFIGTYTGRYYPATLAGVPVELHSTAPWSPVPPVHSVEILAVSPQAVAIFGEAAAAEAWNLTEVAGCGYRKALEFLIKDYCVSVDGDHADDIRKKLLGRVIEDHIPDGGIKACAKRAAWLGNDETHYVRRWGDMDLANLKELFALTESWITTDERTRAYLAKMEE